MKIRSFICVMLALSISLVTIACTSSTPYRQEELIQTELAKISINTQTIPLEPVTESITPTTTFTPEATTSPTQQPTSQNQIIQSDLEKFLCPVEDLPAEGYYYIPDESWKSKVTNEEVIKSRGEIEGRKYVMDTGRVDGWYVERMRNSINSKTLQGLILPTNIWCSVTLFKTSEGANLAMKKFNNVETEKEEGWQYIPEDLTLGDDNIIFRKYQNDSLGNKNMQYEIDFTYKNLLGRIGAFGTYEQAIQPLMIEQIARLMLDRFQKEPLINPEDASFPE
jgi:hypothetical protein